MAPMLTSEQRDAMAAGGGQSPIPVFDPEQNRTYYLLPPELFEQWQRESNAGEVSLEGMYPLMDEVARREGWDDPEMDVYDQLDPRTMSRAPSAIEPG
jgi:hypothetical protein